MLNQYGSQEAIASHDNVPKRVKSSVEADGASKERWKVRTCRAESEDLVPVVCCDVLQGFGMPSCLKLGVSFWPRIAALGRRVFVCRS